MCNMYSVTEASDREDLTEAVEISQQKADTAQVILLHGWLSRAHFDPGYPSCQWTSRYGISIAHSKGCNYNLSNGLISPDFRHVQFLHNVWEPVVEPN